MKKVIAIVVVFMTLTSISSQITTTVVAKPKEQIDNIPYDSIHSFEENAHKIIGQDLYLKGLFKEIQKYGYRGFVKDYTILEYKKSNIYKYDKACTGGSSYEELNGKYFTVIDVVSGVNKKNQSVDYLKLQRKDTKDVFYYQYPEYETDFQFVMVGFVMKLKHDYIGKEYNLRYQAWRSFYYKMIDIKTGNEIPEFDVETKWKCVDVTMSDIDFTPLGQDVILIYENTKKEQVQLEQMMKLNTNLLIEVNNADIYKKKFGAEKWKLIFTGNIELGMTKEMCELSKGRPNKINETKTTGGITEQWVYKNSNLYFENGILTAIQ